MLPLSNDQELLPSGGRKAFQAEFEYEAPLPSATILGEGKTKILDTCLGDLTVDVVMPGCFRRL